MSSAWALLLSVTMLNVAHRGLWKEANLPQNTVEAIRAAYEAGASVVETDFVETKSGEIICLHDRIPLLEDVLAVVPKDRMIQAEIKTYGPTYTRQFDAAVRARAA